MWPQISGILDFGDFGFWILGILDFGDFGLWGFWILDFGPLCSKSLCEAPNAPNLGIWNFGFWGFWGFWILGILDFGDFGFWILRLGGWKSLGAKLEANFGFYIRVRRLCTPPRVGGFRIYNEGLQYNAIQLIIKGFTSSPSKSHGAALESSSSAGSWNYDPKWVLHLSLPWTSEMFTVVSGLTPWQLPQSVVNYPVMPAVFTRYVQEILDVFGRLRQVNWWQQIMHTCQGAWGWGWGRVGQPSWNGLNMPMMQGETCDMICMFRMCCRNHNSCQGSFRCRSRMSSFEHENSIRLVTEQGYAAFANVFVCCDVGYIKLIQIGCAIQRVLGEHWLQAFLHHLRHPSQIKIAFKVGWS